MFQFKKVLIFVVVLACIPVFADAQTKPPAVSPLSDETAIQISKTGAVGVQSPPRTLNGIMDAKSASQLGGDRLEAMQYTDGSWGWPLTAPPTFGNILGPIAMGVGQAYQQTGDAGMYSTLSDAGTYLLGKTNNFSPSDGYLAAELDRLLGVSTYTAHVKTNFYDKLADGTYNRNGLGTLYTTASYVNLIRTSRAGATANLAAWDIGMGLVGAAECGESTAEWIAGVKAEIDELDSTGYYDVIGLAGAIYGLAFVDEDYDPTAGQHAWASDLDDLASILAGYQISGGGFTWNAAYVSPGNETNQESAYAILALSEANQAFYLSSMQGAADYLMSVQLGTGGWDNYPGDPDGENNELTGEALWGIIKAYPPPVHNAVKDLYYPTIQDGIDGASPGDVLQVAPGTYDEYLDIPVRVTIVGSGVGSTIIDASGFAGSNSSGIYVHADSVRLEGFEFVGLPGSALPRYGIKYADVTGGSVSDVLIHGVYRTGLDLLGSISMSITGVESRDNNGHGIAATDCHDITFTNITTSGNAWQSMSIATWGRYTPLGTDGIVIAGTNSFGGLFQLEQGKYPSGPPEPITWSSNILDGADVTVQTADFAYAVTGGDDEAPAYQRVYFVKTFAEAEFLLANAPIGHLTGDCMYIQDIGNATQFYVTPGGSIECAIAAASDGDEIDVSAGTYAEGSPQVVIDKDISVNGADKTTTIIVPAANTGGSGDARGWFFVQPGKEFNLNNVTLDGAGKNIFMAVLSHGTGTIDNNIIRNIKYTKYLGMGLMMYGGNFVISNNTLYNIERIGMYCNGTGVTNGQFIDNTYTGKGDGDWLDYGIEIEAGAVATATGNTITDCRGVASSDGSTSAGMYLTTYFAPGTTGTFLDNTVTDCYVGLEVGYLPTDGSLAVAHGNTFADNTGYGVYTTNPYVDARNNYWGTLHGPADPVGTIEVPKLPAPAVADAKNALPAPNLGNAVNENIDYWPWIGPASGHAHGGIWASGYVNPTANDIFLGFDVAALDGVDPMDTVAPPPPPSDYLYLYSLLAPGMPIENYSVDIRKEEASLATAAKGWDLRALTDHTSETVNLAFLIETLPAAFHPTLHDITTGDYKDLSADPTYSYMSPASVTPSSFRLLIGDSTKPAVAVTAPNGGEYLIVGTPYNVTWTSSDATGVLKHYIYYSGTGAAPYTLLDSVNGATLTYAWTPLAAAATASIKVTARDSVMNEETDISDYSFTVLASSVVSYNALAGWNLVSVPMLQGTMTPAAVFGDDYGATPYYTFGFNPATGYSVPASLAMGQGYWLGSNSAQAIDADGTPLSTATLPLQSGFNIIGDPFASDMDVADLAFTDGLNTYDIAGAAGAGWLSNVLYGYDGSGYYVESSALELWNGYWVPMLMDGISAVYTPTVTGPTPGTVPVVESDPDGWEVALDAVLTSGAGTLARDRIAVLGVRADASAAFSPKYDAPRPPRSPAESFIEVSFTVPENSFRSRFGDAPCARKFMPPDKAGWEIVVKTSSPGEITLRWDNAAISALPGHVKVDLFDAATGATIDMKGASSYTWSQEGTERRFQVNKPAGLIPGGWELSQNYPNPFNPTTTISYGLPSDAVVTIDVFNFLGQKVATLLSGDAVQPAGYHEVTFDAANLASGFYYYTLTARAGDGGVFTDVRKMILLK
jgi:hypothetical protein